MSRKALALEGGSLRCLFTCGATDLMMDEGLQWDGIIGVSAGALTGVNIVSGQRGRTAQVNLGYVNDPRYMGFRSLIKHRSIFNFDFLFGELSDTLLPLDRETFINSEIKYTAVATSCIDGRVRYYEKSEIPDIYPAIRASASLPLLSPMVTVGGEPCLDGGLSVSVPYQRPLDEGYDKVVVITTREHGYRKEPVSRAMARVYARAYRKYPELVRAILNVPRHYNAEMDEIDHLEAQGRIFVIRPREPVTVSRTEKNVAKLQDLYDRGQEACRIALPKLREYLES
ncbi:patatin-like phospholipase family protein [Acutalibacter sp. 1XD8-36]|uniref:patatin-like phospholipase family protein n=1 Tax=Acutalibacter sp. 1XD8-36 TaxID=2320852 RepID=UPI00141279EB|nr:patatin family protein [Acutalibacter sp. 1XD8-36]NBJ89998.1 patatin family protein [Acutalibacter sp. 1XD8-36]